VPEPRALVVDDSREINLLIQSVLEKEGYQVTTAATGRAGIEAARRQFPELVILDLSLPDGDGLDVCREIRTFSDAYLVMVTARDDEVDKIVGLTVGADDYITKPFSPRELAARVRAMRRRPRSLPQDPDRIVQGPLEIDVSAREAVLDGVPLELTKIEFDMLLTLASAPRRTFTRGQLLERVWGEWYGDDHLIDVHIGNLRRKLGESASDQRLIRTVRGVGYRFEVPAPGDDPEEG
jgi:DNA-binding response OmpR family regulator